MNSRALAAQILASVVTQRCSLDSALEEGLPQIPQDNDRAFVQALCFGVLRMFWRLDFIVRRLAAKPIRDEQVRMLVLLGLYQLEYTRVKPHAALAETVSACGGKVWAKPLVNAILRNFQRQREALLALADADETAAFSHPAWLIDKIRQDWPNDFPAILQQNNQQPPLSLRVNRLRVGRARYLELLAEHGIAAQACAHAESGVVLETPMAVERLPGFAEGWASVQDEAAQLAAGLLDLSSGQRVLDVCAAPGGKTVHILETCPSLAEVLAVDIAPERLARIRENLARAGLEARVMAGDGGEPAAWWDGKPFDRILVDAPCSATGVIRRHPDIKLLRQPEDIDRLVVAQARILDAAWSLLAEGGILLYATCSSLQQENQAQIAAFLARHPEAREWPIEAVWGRAASHGRLIATGEDGMDGFYYARVRK